MNVVMKTSEEAAALNVQLKNLISPSLIRGNPFRFLMLDDDLIHSARKISEGDVDPVLVAMESIYTSLPDVQVKPTVVLVVASGEGEKIVHTVFAQLKKFHSSLKPPLVLNVEKILDDGVIRLDLLESFMAEKFSEINLVHASSILFVSGSSVLLNDKFLDDESPFKRKTDYLLINEFLNAVPLKLFDFRKMLLFVEKLSAYA